MKNKNLYIYHNNKCSKSREVINFLKDNKINFEIINYLIDPIDDLFLKQTLKSLENNILEVVRTNEKVYKTKFNNKKLDLSFDEIHSLLKEFPILIQRPIAVVIKNNNIFKSTICRPPEKIKKFLI
tara:strand:+ start:143 stop:520 length:378 start_codon:yes stop_codon:yes gene_type:complete